MPIVSVDVINVKYDHFVEYLSHVDELKEFIKSKGASKCGFLMTEAGGSDEVVVLSEWESIEARSKAMDEITPEGIALHMKINKCIAMHQNHLCFRNPGVHFEAKEGHIPHRIRINVYKASGNPMEAAAHYIETIKELKGMTGSDVELRSLLHPIAFNGNFNLIAIFEETDTDGNMAKAMKAMADPANADKLKKIRDTFSALSYRHLKVITPEKIAQIKKAAHH